MPDAPQGALVLDTHVWIWMVEAARDRLSSQSIQEIGAASDRGEVLISAISVWELSMLEAKDRIHLSRPVDEWVREALRAPGVRLLPLSPEIAIESTRLPSAPHGDPADRILMASARVEGGRLATRDGEIIRYAEDGHLNVLDVNP